ncbi:hypothetical protein [Endozoicomonas sp. YOMI1]|uniref:hypothetical protein n=1 Tax=Endozoicomonas sp. YOMI1 TaxID=2828739 RepID=UPI0021480EF0|nr:hypothetical protein [Endozoicomonas sp. YOMI1]
MLRLRIIHPLLDSGDRYIGRRDRHIELCNFQPQSLQACARTSIRLRLVEHWKKTGQPLSKSLSKLTLYPMLKAYFYEPLTPDGKTYLHLSAVFVSVVGT